MAVTVSIGQLAVACRLATDPAATVPEPDRTVLQGILDFASVEAVAVAPGAPDAHHNRAVIQLSAYLYDQPPSTRGAMFGNAMVNSGAYFVLRRYVKRRAVALEATP